MSLQAVNVVPNVILVFSVPPPFISLSLPVSLPLPLPNKRISTGLATGYITFIFELPGNVKVLECVYYALEYNNSYSQECFFPKPYHEHICTLNYIYSRLNILS